MAERSGEARSANAADRNDDEKRVGVEKMSVRDGCGGRSVGWLAGASVGAPSVGLSAEVERLLALGPGEAEGAGADEFSVPRVIAEASAAVETGLGAAEEVALVAE